MNNNSDLCNNNLSKNDNIIFNMNSNLVYYEPELVNYNKFVEKNIKINEIVEKNIEINLNEIVYRNIEPPPLKRQYAFNKL